MTKQNKFNTKRSHFYRSIDPHIMIFLFSFGRKLQYTRNNYLNLESLVYFGIIVVLCFTACQNYIVICSILCISKTVWDHILFLALKLFLAVTRKIQCQYVYLNWRILIVLTVLSGGSTFPLAMAKLSIV